MRRCDDAVKKLVSLRLNNTKIAILLYLMSHGWSKLGEIAKHLGLTKSSVWKHLKDLQVKGLVKVKYSLSKYTEMKAALTEKGVEVVLEYSKILEDLMNCLEGEGEKSLEGEEGGEEEL